MIVAIAHSAAVLTTRLVCGISAYNCGLDFEQAAPRIFYANHTSNFDFPALWSALPPRQRRVTRPVAARDYWGSGGIREFFARRCFRAIFVDRRRTKEGPFDPLAEVRTALQAGNSIIIFPEGTRSLDGSIQPFRSGLYHLSTHFPFAECVPVYLENLNRILPKGEVLAVPLLSRIYFGPPLARVEGEKKQDFLQRAEDALRQLIPGDAHAAAAATTHTEGHG